ncbi:disks large 1 tumor suppressor protein isoform X3 [Nasonia vitripennis]|uniref:Uncharacterized protein n=1 Tax=Nasonia vitripennis TaxID=7425 RepID=A0A7M7QB97_NASVI|nr:disks large 1 tumor suppressor protein isoform X3 [Nasonia vitripennis]
MSIIYEGAWLPPYDTHRALELLSDYYSRLTKSPEKQLLIEIERFIRILKSRFFQALIDIQEYYEITLLDGMKVNNLINQGDNIFLNSLKICREDRRLSVCSITNNNYSNNNDTQDCWSYVEIAILRRESGLGFSIAGGTDNPHLQNDYHIYITKIIPDGAAANDDRLRINDIIEKVNDCSLINLTHSTAVDILKRAGDSVKLYVRRKNYGHNLKEIELLKGENGFGFSIAGGISNQHIPGDNGIYITKIQDKGAAQIDSRLRVGQKLVAVKNIFGYRDLENVSHEEAVEALKSTKDKIILYILESEDNKFKNIIPTRDLSVLKDNPPIIHQQMFTNHVEQKISCYTKNDNYIKTRTITLNKGPRGLGFNIVGGEDGAGIYISYILAGGPADNDGKLQKGDRLLNVNGIDFSIISHEEAAKVLKGTDGKVTLIVQHDLEEYNRFDAKLNNIREYRSQQPMNIGTLIKTTEKKSMYVRALFDYDPNKDDDLPSLGLNFDFGDILHVTNASDDEWWLATKVFPESNEGFGIIPARKRWERKQRARDRSVKFEGHTPVLIDKQSNTDKRKKNYSFSRKFPFMKNKDDKSDDYFDQEHPGSKEILYRVELPFMEELTLVYLENDADEDDSQQLCDDEIILSYDTVQNITIDFTRPVIILGPIKDKINDDLITEYPEKFSSCVPHTTRAKRDNEIDGQDYYFMSSRVEMEKDIQNHLFIEAGQYNENLYGTSITAVKEVASQGKHCILDVSGNAIKRLYAAQLYPIALFVKVNSPDSMLHDRGMKVLQVDYAARSKRSKIFLMVVFTGEKYYVMKHETKVEGKSTFVPCRIWYFILLFAQRPLFKPRKQGIIKGDSYQDIYEKVKKNIFKQSKKNVWISCKNYNG